ncbi:DUF4188 domain-containing protein [Salinirubrum litoreum]|uniref:DUF4188 domain-containing protein n=1 Tax=Salinirubrum litoreum TaxID=1126234 RepID=A0ABD5RDH0_9EURY|nr:DUF4188 domain-containing protein [Salinirubrum litoreum]
MTAVDTRRVTADPAESFVVFLIGMRVNRLWKLHRWLPVAAAMPRMLRQLAADPESGLLGTRTTVGWRTITVIQYWDSAASLTEYARDPASEHLPAWVDYNREVGGSGDVGIWHETYRVDPTDTESVYRNMPAFGLGEAVGVREATGDSESAARRLGESDEAGLPVSPDGVLRREE